MYPFCFKYIYTIYIYYIFAKVIGLLHPLNRYPLQVRHKQDWDQGFILLLPQAAVLPESDAGNDVIKPASSFVIQNHQTSCSNWCPMHRACC